jgi:DNA-binding response OmpR family regulator
MALGANAYMTKPFSTRDLVGRVRELLEDAG